MFNKLKMKSAARRVNNRRRSRNTRRTARPTFWGRVWNIICAPFRFIWRVLVWIWNAICAVFRFIGRVLVRIWNWICGLDLVGLLNLTLLIAIIVLFSMLIIDIVKCRRNTVVVVPEPIPVVADASDTATRANNNDTPVKKTVVLPIKRNAVTNKPESEPVNVVPVNPVEVEIVEKQTARIDDTIYGDTIIDSRGAGAVLKNGSRVQGNVYIQRMHKYTLPCDIVIDGDLYLRDMGLLQFCGDFTVTGNIYVSPRSAFGPIPRTARIGGQVIL